MSYQIFQVDSFTSEPFKGNPAAVCLLEEAQSEQWMQSVAQEMNLSETAFLVKKARNKYSLRWFTPKAEVDLCGHATLASAHVLLTEEIVNKQEMIDFTTKSGILQAKEREEGWIELQFPSVPYHEGSIPEEIYQALDGVHPVAIYRSEFDYVVELETEAQVRRLQPDMPLLSKLSSHGVIVTAKAKGNAYDFVSRVFCPSLGIPEDPVTGSAHCVLAPYWQQKMNKDTFFAYQASERGGELRLQVHGERVHLLGQAITVLKGDLL